MHILQLHAKMCNKLIRKLTSNHSSYWCCLHRPCFDLCLKLTNFSLCSAVYCSCGPSSFSLPFWWRIQTTLRVSVCNLDVLELRSVLFDILSSLLLLQILQFVWGFPSQSFSYKFTKTSSMSNVSQIWTRHSLGYFLLQWNAALAAADCETLHYVTIHLVVVILVQFYE